MSAYRAGKISYIIYQTTKGKTDVVDLSNKDAFVGLLKKLRRPDENGIKGWDVADSPRKAKNIEREYDHGVKKYSYESEDEELADFLREDDKPVDQDVIDVDEEIEKLNSNEDKDGYQSICEDDDNSDDADGGDGVDDDDDDDDDDEQQQEEEEEEEEVGEFGNGGGHEGKSDDGNEVDEIGADGATRSTAAKQGGRKGSGETKNWGGKRGIKSSETGRGGENTNVGNDRKKQKASKSGAGKGGKDEASVGNVNKGDDIDELLGERY